MKKNNIYVIIGARPQFIKYAPLSEEIAKIDNSKLIVIHTGQHYDDNMSEIFFKTLNIPAPDINLNINDVSRGTMIGEMIKKIDCEFNKHTPDMVILFGDTNSTLAGAVAASSYQCEIVHVEAGLRSYNKLMPEEHNRIVADHLSTILCVTSEEPKTNLLKEGISHKKIFLTGDIMLDTFKKNKQKIFSENAYEKIGYKKNAYILCTVHRRENIIDKEKLFNIFKALNMISEQIMPVILPIHPATKKYLDLLNLNISSIKIVNPYEYIKFLSLVDGANFVITDSGGLQKDAYYLKKKTLVFRNESEWPELADNNASILVDPLNFDAIINNVNLLIDTKIKNKNLYGNGTTAKQINKIIKQFLSK